jgi:hypothetical protein
MIIYMYVHVCIYLRIESHECMAGLDELKHGSRSIKIPNWSRNIHGFYEKGTPSLFSVCTAKKSDFSRVMFEKHTLIKNSKSKIETLHN